MQARGLILVVVCSLTMIAGLPVASGANRQDTLSKAELEKRLQALLHQRVVTAERAVDALQAAFEAETVTLDVMLVAVNKLADARLAVATTSEQKIDALEKRLKAMATIEQKIRVLFNIGTRGGEAKELAMAERERQSAEIALIEALLKAMK